MKGARQNKSELEFVGFSTLGSTYITKPDDSDSFRSRGTAQCSYEEFMEHIEKVNPDSQGKFLHEAPGISGRRVKEVDRFDWVHYSNNGRTPETFNENRIGEAPSAQGQRVLSLPFLDFVEQGCPKTKKSPDAKAFKLPSVFSGAWNQQDYHSTKK
jgi:hypothetical protein